MLVGPAPPADTREEMVEPPGIAPGSGPLITSAFIAIVRANPDSGNIGTIGRREKGFRSDLHSGDGVDRHVLPVVAASGPVGLPPALVPQLAALANAHADLLAPIGPHDVFTTAHDAFFGIILRRGGGLCRRRGRSVKPDPWKPGPKRLYRVCPGSPGLWR